MIITRQGSLLGADTPIDVTARITSARTIATVIGPKPWAPSATPIQIPMEKQESDGKLALQDYVNERRDWLLARKRTRAQAMLHVPTLKILTYYACRSKYHGHGVWHDALVSHAGEAMAEAILAKASRENCPSIELYPDIYIEMIAAATDDWETLDSSPPYQPNPLSSNWNPASGTLFCDPPAGGASDWTCGSRSDISRPHTYSWMLLRDGFSPTTNYPDIIQGVSDPARYDLATITYTNGLSGLYWYTEAVPAVRLLARLSKGSPNWPTTQIWIEKLEPLTYSNVTQQDLDAEAGRYAFSNPLVRNGDIRAVAAAITRAVNDASKDTQDMPTESGVTSSPWFWVILLGGGAAAGYYLWKRKKASSGGSK